MLKLDVDAEFICSALSIQHSALGGASPPSAPIGALEEDSFCPPSRWLNC
jgi:hypothetical protein